MKILLQLALIFGICLVGDFISPLLPFTFPGSIIAMLILLVLLLAKVVKPSLLSETNGYFTQNMAFFFLPANIGIMEHLELIKPVVIQLIFICIISTVATFAAASYAARFVIFLQDKTRNRKHTEAGK